MKRKAEGENARARTGVRNQAFSSTTTEEAKTTTLASPRTRVQQYTQRCSGLPLLRNPVLSA